MTQKSDSTICSLSQGKNFGQSYLQDEYTKDNSIAESSPKADASMELWS